MTNDVFGNGTKETWRGTMLNECFRRLPSPSYMRKQMRAVYLAGPTDRDGPALVKRGLLKENLIAVDVDDECVRSVRDEGAIAICAKVQDVLLSISEPIDLVLLDLMGGMTKQTSQVLCSLWFSRAMHKNTVVMVNLLAGRDPMALVLNDGSERSPHRGRLAFEGLGHSIHSILAKRLSEPDCERLVSNRMGMMNPWYGRYYSPGSNGVRKRYDSVVLTWGDDMQRELPPVRYKATSRNRELKQAGRKMAAAKAIRTMRLAGTL